MKATLVTVITTLLCLCAAELAMRWLDGYALGSIPLSRLCPPSAVAAESGAERHLDQISRAPGVDRAWFFENPPEPPRRGAAVDAARAQQYRDYIARGLPGPQSHYVWNRAFVEDNHSSEWEASVGRLPENIAAFTPEGGRPRPVYRFPPSEHLPSGLVTNRYGFRGADPAYAGDVRQVVVAFVGASTTQEDYSFPFSFPERVGFWLNRWAEAEKLPVRFDVLNAGREGIGSRDIAEIVAQELRPLRPDFVVYLEGSNQTQSYRRLVRRPEGGAIPVAVAAAPSSAWDAWTRWSAIAVRVRELAQGKQSLNEPPKPRYELDREQLTLTRLQKGEIADLPLSLDQICGDLRRIHSTVEENAGTLLLSTFTWFDPRGIALDPVRHRGIHEQLNARTWPLTNADWHELMDYQNEVFRTFARVDGIPLIDADRQMPPDPDLFADPIHVTPAGSRLRAWIIFNAILPHIRAAIDSGRVPRSNPVQRDWSYGPIEQIRRPDRRAPVVAPPDQLIPRPTDVFHPRRYTLLDPSAQIAPSEGTGVRVRTGPQQWTSAVGFDFESSAVTGASGRLLLEVELRVLSGAVGLGFKRFDHPDTVRRQIVSSEENDTVVTFRLEPDEIISQFVIENAVGGGPSEVEIRAFRWKFPD